MKKKKFFLLASIAALAMTSCSSFDEPAVQRDDDTYIIMTRAGETYVVRSEAALRNAVANKRSSIAIGGDFSLTSELELSYPVTISGTTGKTLSTFASIICKSDVKFQDLVIDATTQKGTGAINLAADNISVVLNNTQVTQNTAGTSDSQSTVGIGIMYQAYENVNFRLENNTVIKLPNNYVRGIDMLPGGATEISKLEIDHSKIIMGTDLSNPAVYGRGISFSYIKTKEGVPVKITDSTIEGGYYAININGDNTGLQFEVENSILNGRCGFNVWSAGTVANIKGGTIIGQNPYMGGYENFANVKINNGADNCTFTFDDTTFEMYRKEGNPYNNQLMVMTGGANTTLNFLGSVNVYDYTKQTLHFLGGSGSVTSINVSGLNNIHLVEANSKATIL